MTKPLYQRSDGGRIGDWFRRWFPNSKIHPANRRRPGPVGRPYMFTVNVPGMEQFTIALSGTPEEWAEETSRPTFAERQDFYRGLGMVFGDAMQDFVDSQKQLD